MSHLGSRKCGDGKHETAEQRVITLSRGGQTMTSYDEAVSVLYQAAPKSFVAERKRLSAELKAAGESEAAVRLAKLARPPVSAWVVNQLFWRERESFDALLAAAKRVRDGDQAATQAHREAVAELRALASTLLDEAGHAAQESTLRRVTSTLSAIAAAGGFEPDPPGALSTDRDPPGFEAVADSIADSVAAEDDAGTAAAAVDERRRAQDERQRAKTEELARKQEQRRLEAELREATGTLDGLERELAQQRKALAAGEARAERARAAVVELERRLAALVRR
jgi:hypothetical protein